MGMDSKVPVSDGSWARWDWGAQRFYAAKDFNAADNLFIFMFANFGVFALLYLAIVVVITARMFVSDYVKDSAGHGFVGVPDHIWTRDLVARRPDCHNMVWRMLGLDSLVRTVPE